MIKNYRLSITPALEVKATAKVFRFHTITELVAAGDTAADLLLFIQDDLKAMASYSNIFISERWDADDQEWIEID